MKGCCLAWAAVLAACCPCLLRAAEEPAKRPARVVELERFPAYQWLLPNGELITLGGSMATIVYSDDPRAVELERRHHAEMKELIAQGKYKLHRSFGQEKWGGKR